MPDPPRSLDQIQRWMQSVITHPLGVRAGAASDAARDAIDATPEEVDQVVCPSRQQSSYQRLAVYGNAYYMRLLECLDDVFPVTKKMVGEDIFHQMALDYLQAHPSHSYTLGRLGARFAEFLTTARPEAAEWSDLLIDLVRLEWALDEVFDGPGVEGQPLLSHDRLATIPPDRWPEAVLRPVVCLRLMRFDFPISEFYTHIRQDEQPAEPVREKSFLALTRRDYVVRRYALSRPQFVLLSALCEGQPIATAMERLAGETNATDEELAQQLVDWFHFWATEGFFQSVDVPST